MSVFISHSTKDDAVVAEIRRALESRRIEVWADSQRLAPGNLLEPKVVAAIDACTHCIAILSRDAVNSPWVRKEIAHAVKAGKPVIPVMLPGIEVGALGLWFAEEPVGLRIEVGPGGVAAALPQLLAGLGLALPADAAPPVVPPAVPIADLVLELRNPAIDTSD